MERRSFLKALLGFPVVAGIPEVLIAEEAVWTVNPVGGFTNDENFLFNGELGTYQNIRFTMTYPGQHIWQTYAY